MYFKLKIVHLSKIRILVLTMFAVWISFSCSEDEDSNLTPNTTQTNWVKSSGFDEGIINSIYTDNKLYIMGANTFYSDASITSTNTPFIFEKFNSRPGWHKLPISNTVLASKTELDIFILPVSGLADENHIKINPKTYDPTFIKFEDIPRWQSEGMGISNSGSILVPYRTAKEGIAENNPSFLLINTSEVNTKIIVTDVKVVNPEIINYYDQVYQIDSFNDFFILTVGNEIIQISDLGVVSNIGTFNSFRSTVSNNEIHSFGINRTLGEVSYFKSRIDGTNRQLISKKSIEPLFDGLEIISINNQIIGFKNDKIYLIEMGSNGMKMTELNNAKLEGGFITSIVLVNENTVLVTATCHVICGAYSKSLDNFFEVKNP
ncbi:hypothetical protein [Belliella aquatica]|nr:hypothetical protein [Belliella aquatica]MCH7405907.1 hypothetical protein [Belliella aquatica]